MDRGAGVAVSRDLQEGREVEFGGGAQGTHCFRKLKAVSRVGTSASVRSRSELGIGAVSRTMRQQLVGVLALMLYTTSHTTDGRPRRSRADLMA